MKALINGIEYDAQINFSISEQTGNKTSSDISVVVNNQPFPVSGDIIELKDDNENTIFWGTCGIPSSPKYQTGYEKKIYSITCGNANSILSNRIINVAFQEHTITEIVQALFDNYISQENITIGKISDIPVTMEVYTAGDFNLQDALNELADLVGAVWRVDNQKKFYFIVKEEFPKFPHVINKNFLLGTELQHKTKDYLTRTVQYVTGATDYTSAQEEKYTYDGEQDAFTTVFPLAEKPKIYVNDEIVPSDRIGINGIDDIDENIVFSFSYNSQTIAIKDKEYLETGDTIFIVYVGIFPIRVVAYNNSKIEEIAALTGTSGLRENVYIATNVTTTQDALQLANSLLTQFEQSTGEITFWILSSQLERLGMSIGDTELLTQIEFNLSELGITGTYLIVERTITPASISTGDYKISLRLADRNYLKSYGETISNLYRDISQLFIRQDDVIINQNNTNEIIKLSEEMISSSAMPSYPTPNIVNGGLFVFVQFDYIYYPMAGGSYSGKLENDIPHYPTQTITPSDGNMFIPADLNADIYPI